MASLKSKTSIRDGASGRDKPGDESMAFFLSTGAAPLAKGRAAFKIKIPDIASKALTGNPNRVKTLLQEYGQAIAKSRSAGRPVSFRVDVDSEGEMVVTPVEEVERTTASVVEEKDALDPELEQALVAARVRGRTKAAEVLSGTDMLNADEFAKRLGTTRVTVNSKRQNGLVLGLDGAKRGFRFPDWQIDADGKPFAALPMLHERLGGPWAVYRFLVQPHGELDGLTGREALERGRAEQALEVVESIGRDFR